MFGQRGLQVLFDRLAEQDGGSFAAVLTLGDEFIQKL
jgi:hypothetical protein